MFAGAQLQAFSVYITTTYTGKDVLRQFQTAVILIDSSRFSIVYAHTQKSLSTLHSTDVPYILCTTYALLGMAAFRTRFALTVYTYLCICMYMLRDCSTLLARSKHCCCCCNIDERRHGGTSHGRRCVSSCGILHTYKTTVYTRKANNKSHIHICSPHDTTQQQQQQRSSNISSSKSTAQSAQQARRRRAPRIYACEGCGNCMGLP